MHHEAGFCVMAFVYLRELTVESSRRIELDGRLLNLVLLVDVKMRFSFTER